MVRNKHMYEETCEMKPHKEHLIRDIIKRVDVLPWLVTFDGCVSLYKRDSYF